MNAPDDDNLLKAAQVAKVLGCGVHHPYDLFDRGELEGFRDGRNIRFFAWSVREYIARNRNAKATAPAVPVKQTTRVPAQVQPLPRMGSVAVQFLQEVRGGARSGDG